MVKVGKLKKFVLFYFALSIYCNSYLMFMWYTYDIKVFSLIAKFIGYTGPIFLLLYCILLKRIKYGIKRWVFGILFIILLLEAHMNIFGYSYTSFVNVSDIRLIVAIFTLFLLTDEDKTHIFEYSLKIFAIVSLPCVVYFVMRNIGISLPYDILLSEHAGKAARGAYYEHYPLGLMLVYPGAMTRMCGIFDEPGVVGTLSGIFLATGYDKVSKKWAIILLIEGIASFSLAFFLLLIIYTIVRATMNGFAKMAIIVTSLVVVFVLFINIDFENEYITAIQNRVDFSSTYLFKDNRTTEAFDSRFQEFIDEGGYAFWMGYGKGAAANDSRLSSSSSYKCLIYDYGIVGSLLYIGVFVLTYILCGINKKTIPFGIVFFASIYQRPYVFNLQFFTIFLTALSFINFVEEYEICSLNKG